MKALIISDTHSQHDDLTIHIPKVDLLIHCGDSTNFKDPLRNQIEFEKFESWLVKLPIKHKILIAGNHDTWALKKYNKDKLKDHGIIYLEHEYYELNSVIFFGSPYTPTFGNWNFMVPREKLSRYWEVLDEQRPDVLITHGPPKGILDRSHDKQHKLEYCGDSALLKAVIKHAPSVHCFGHIHNSKDNINSGVFKPTGYETTFVNASCITDRKEGITSYGQIGYITKDWSHLEKIN